MQLNRFTKRAATALVWEVQSFAPLLENPALPWKQATFACIPIKGLRRSVRTKDFRYAEWRSDTSWRRHDSSGRAHE